MAKTAKELVAEAKGQIENLSVDQVAQEQEQGALIVDIREENERQVTGTIAGAIAAPRGMLEFYADPATPYHKPELQQDARIILHCASGGRSALAAETLQKMGYSNVAHMEAGFKGWKEAGKPVEGG